MANPRNPRSPIAQAFDAFTVAVFFIVMIITLLAVSYGLGNSGRRDGPSPGPMAWMTPAIKL